MEPVKTDTESMELENSEGFEAESVPFTKAEAAALMAHINGVISKVNAMGIYVEALAEIMVEKGFANAEKLQASVSEKAAKMLADARRGHQ